MHLGRSGDRVDGDEQAGSEVHRTGAGDVRRVAQVRDGEVGERVALAQGDGLERGRGLLRSELLGGRVPALGVGAPGGGVLVDV